MKSESTKIHSAKYLRAPSLRPEYVMCVYCLDKEREKVWSILASLGVNRRIWKYDRQTHKDWQPGGKLYKEWQGKK